MSTSTLHAFLSEVNPLVVAIDAISATDPERVGWDPARCRLAVCAVVPIINGEARPDRRDLYTERRLPELRRLLRQADVIVCWGAEFDLGLIFGGQVPEDLPVVDLFEVLCDLAGYRVPLWVAARDTLGRRLTWSRDAHELWAARRYRDVAWIAVDHAETVAELAARAERGEEIAADGRAWQCEPGQFLGLGAAQEATAIA